MDIGAPELIIILIVLLMISGPGRIVNVVRELGVSIREFRKGLEEQDEEGDPDQIQPAKGFEK